MGKKRNYLVYTLNARELLNICDKKDNIIDFNDRYVRRRVLKDEGKYAMSALYYQIIKAARDAGDERSAREIINKALVYLDFERDIKDIRKKTERLLTDGFNMLFEKETEPVRFVPFDRSASMSRECTCSFICDDLFDAVNEALDVGLDKERFEVAPSKYYAYRGLYMTDGVAVDSGRLMLNEKTVIVLRTPAGKLDDGIFSVTVSPETDADGRIAVSDKVQKIQDFIEYTPFDGEGLISPDYAEKINREIVHRRGVRAASFQIRMPFCKGMLHTVNFKKFIKDQFPDEDYDSLEVTDFYGIKRKLADAEIILTESMFKCVKWLESQLGIYETDPDTGKKVLSGFRCDPMRFYFDKFAEYDHALYIANMDINIRGKNQVRMNYQFLNTLDISRETLEKLVQKHIEKAEAMLTDHEAGREALLNMDDPDDHEIDSDRIAGMDSWEYALMTNVRFVNDPMIRKRLKKASKLQIKNIVSGRINVDGCIKYLSSDLMQLLIILAENMGVSDVKRIEELKSSTLLSDRFFVTGIDFKNITPDKYYGVLRSPHLSRNEQCALRPYSSPLYKKYFGRLRGVMMLSQFSDAAAAMGGADFDGDMVKIIMDDDINQSILKSVYQPDTEKGPDTHGIMSYKRRLSIPVITPPDGERQKLGRFIKCNDLEASFSSRVGHISNIAVQIAQLESKGQVPENSAALCTIATGLEIDSVKTGKKPDLSYLEKLVGKKQYTYLKTVDYFKRNRQASEKEFYPVYDADKDEYSVSHAYGKKRVKGKPVFTAGGDSENNIDLLPYFFAKSVAESRAGGRAVPKFTDEDPAYNFVFELYNDWREIALSDSRTVKLRGIIGAYRKLAADSWNIGKAERDSKEDDLRGKIVTLLDVEYDTDVDRLYRSGEFIEEALETAYMEMDGIIKDEAFAKEALEMMVDLNWQYVNDYESKVDCLKEIIGTSDLPTSALEIICDTYDNGYQILNYILRDYMNLRRLGQMQRYADADDDTETEYISPWTREYDEKLFRKMFAGFRAYHSREDYTKADWLDDAGAICRKAVIDLFDGDIDRAVECTVALDKPVGKKVACDEKHKFLWDVFTAEDLGGIVYDKQKKGPINVK